MNRLSQGLRRHPVASGVGLAVLVLLGGFAACEAAGWPFLRGPLQRQLSQRLDRDVQVGQAFKLHLLGSIRLQTDQLTIGPPRWAEQPGERFFDAHAVALRLPWSTVWGLLHSHDHPQPLHVSSLEVGDFDANLWRRKDGSANWQFSLPKKDPKAAPAQMPEFDSLQVRSGRVTLVDAPTDLGLQAEATTAEGDTAQGAGLRVQGNGHYRDGKFQFGLHSSGVLPLIAPNGATVSVPVTLQAEMPDLKLKFDGQAKDILHFREMAGRFLLNGSSLAKAGEPFGVTLPTTAPFDMGGRIGKDGEVWKAGIERFDVGQSHLGGDFSFDQRPEVPMLSGVLRGRNLDLHDLGPAFGAAGPAHEAKKADGRLFPDHEFDIPSLKRMNADVRVDLQRTDLHTALLEPFHPLQGRVRLHDGILTVEDLNAHTSGGTIHGQLALDGRVVDKPRWNGDLRWSGVRLEDWVKFADTHAKPQNAAEEGKAPARHYITGALGGEVKFTGHGRSVAQMLGSLDGTLAAWVNDGTVSHLAMEGAGIDIAQALGVLIKGDDALKMQCAVTQLTARNGVLHTDVGIIDNPDTTLLINGDISLAQEQFALVAQANPKDFSPMTLRAPIHLDGPLAHPHVHLDTKPIAGKAVAALALGAINPLAALIPLIDPGKTAPIGCQQALERLRTPGAKASPPPPKPQQAAAVPGRAQRPRPVDRSAAR
jgi:uncharacterized protein involved in outer membrane biogenesis